MATRRRPRTLDIWPGFVDALSALLMVMIFVLLIFAIGQFVLSDRLAGQNRTLGELQQQVSQLAKTLALAEADKRTLEAQGRQLAASLAAAQQRSEQDQAVLAATRAAALRLQGDLEEVRQQRTELAQQAESLAVQLAGTEDALAEQSTLGDAARAQVRTLQEQLAALHEQLLQLDAALQLAQGDVDRKDRQIADLGERLNLALADRVSELERYRSEFFGKLRETLGQRDDVQVVGDRFVLASDVLFASGSAALEGASLHGLDTLASTVLEVAAGIPSDIDWILRIDGHTDRVPINTAQFPSNWELSSARALAIVKHLVVQGVPAHRLSANGFGEFQPLDTANTAAAHARNRRIEVQLTNR